MHTPASKRSPQVECYLFSAVAATIDSLTNKGVHVKKDVAWVAEFTVNKQLRTCSALDAHDPDTSIYLLHYAINPLGKLSF